MLETLLISGGMTLAALIVAAVFGYTGFWMGRQVADRPVSMPTWPLSNAGGQQILDEYDAYEDALRKPGLDADIKDGGK